MPTGTPYHPPSGRTDWNTPEVVCDALIAFNKGTLDLDPCANGTSVVPALVTYRLDRDEDGLVKPWTLPDVPWTVYCNPPFDDLRTWAAKAAKEARDGAEILFLLPSRTDTRAWHEHIATAQAVLFWKGRLTFMGGQYPAPFPVALAYWGPRPRRFAEVFGAFGLVVTHQRSNP